MRDDRLRLIAGDNRTALDGLLEAGERVHLAYLDPPFFTQRVHQHTHRRRNGHTGRIDRWHTPAFDDRWPDLDSYLATLRERLAQVRELLAPEGCAVIHVDPTVSHYVKVMCDALFGRDAFASEIIWRYRRWPAKTRNFQRVHDVLLRYLRDPRVAEPRFRQLYEPLAASTLATWGQSKQLADFDGQGRRIRSTRTAERSPGVPLGDVWEIGVIAPIARERTGYPTQKPLALLRRLLEACSFEDDVVLDPYVGSGTTLVAAAELGRRGIGIDVSEQAIATSERRLRELGLAYRIEAAQPRCSRSNAPSCR